MANSGNQRIIPLEEGWNDEIKAKVSGQAMALQQNNKKRWKPAAADQVPSAEFTDPKELDFAPVSAMRRAPKARSSGTFQDFAAASVKALASLLLVASFVFWRSTVTHTHTQTLSHHGVALFLLCVGNRQA